MYTINKNNPIKWSANFAYAIGLIVTDGNLSPDNRHISFTSKDKEMVYNFCKCLGILNRIGLKNSGSNKEKIYYVVQFSNVNLYNFLLDIGITKAKSKTIGKIEIPKKYFFDFLRGCIDGDGSISSTKHPESSVRQLRVRLCSASKPFLLWIKQEILVDLGIKSGWIYSNNKSMHVLSYGKNDSIKILKNVYYTDVTLFLKRKFEVAKPFIT